MAISISSSNRSFWHEFEMANNSPPKKKAEPGLRGLNQIDANQYSDPFATAPNPVVKVGVSFDLEQWNIKDWLTG